MNNDALVQNLICRIISTCPDVALSYIQNLPVSMEPTAPTWLSNMTLLCRVCI